jgi:hypothetical protein
MITLIGKLLQVRQVDSIHKGGKINFAGWIGHPVLQQNVSKSSANCYLFFSKSSGSPARLEPGTEGSVPEI